MHPQLMKREDVSINYKMNPSISIPYYLISSVLFVMFTYKTPILLGNRPYDVKDARARLPYLGAIRRKSFFIR